MRSVHVPHLRGAPFWGGLLIIFWILGTLFILMNLFFVGRPSTSFRWYRTHRNLNSSILESSSSFS